MHIYLDRYVEYVFMLQIASYMLYNPFYLQYVGSLMEKEMSLLIQKKGMSLLIQKNGNALLQAHRYDWTLVTV